MTHAERYLDESNRQDRIKPTGLWLCLAAASLLAAPMVSRAQTVSFAGKVVDAAGAPIPWAFIRVLGSDVVGQSVADGSFTWTGTVPASDFPDIRPRPPMAAPTAKIADIPARYTLSGRSVVSAHLASLLLYSVPAPEAAEAAAGLSPTGSLRTLAEPASGSDRPPTPPALSKSGKSGVAYTLTVTMVNYQAGSFPQTAAGAKGLVLTLAKSATDTATYQAEKKLCLDTVNAYRASLGLKALAWSKSIEAFADQGTRWDSDRNEAHNHFGAFVKPAFPAFAENALPGWPLKNYKTVAAVVAKGTEAMWGEGPGGGHYENIKGDHTVMGCGIFINAAGNVWLIQDFK
jgi:hypothetical protein